jgi:protein-tyrosine phosphatase
VSGKLRNLRDLGGLRTEDGRMTRRGVLFRSEAPCGLEDPGLQELAALGLRTSLDLRDEGEDTFARATLPAGVRRVTAGMLPPGDGRGAGLIARVMSGELREYTAEELAELYVGFLEDQAPAFGAAVRHIADPAHLPVLVHCHAGKDRTGLVVAMVLEILGVRRELIVADYELSTEGRAHRRLEVAPALAATGTEWARVAPLFTAPAQALELAFEHIERRYGTVEAYLTGPARVEPERVRALPELLLT